MLLQTLSALFVWGLPGSQELNQQLANHFIEKVEHFMHIPQLVLGHIGYLRHAFLADIQEATQFVMVARHIAASPAEGASPALPCCFSTFEPQTLR